jgi:predicted acylesterase/phospholipase RssA/CRP-like cAMP-binding protein
MDSSGQPTDSDTSLFASLPEESIERLGDLAKPVRLAAGEWLFHEGDQADCAYFVQSGRVQVLSDDVIIRTVRRGAVIGELAPLTGGTRAASARAQRDCHLWRVGRDEFEQLITADPQFALVLCRALGSKLAEHRSPVTASQPPRRIAIVALCGGVSTDDLADRLAAQLASAGEAAVLRSGESALHADHVAAIERAETLSRYVMLSVGDRPGDPWTDAALAEADRVIAVSRGLPISAWSAHTRALQGCELLSLGSSISGALLQALEPEVAKTIPDETAMDRWIALAARRFAQRAVGIVFSGGGARAFAHLGVVEALRAAGVRIDRVGGVSMGAIVAGAVGVEMDDATMFETFHRYFVDQNPSGDYTLPAFSLVRGLRTRRLLAEAFGTATIESLPLRFFCVSADLNSRSAVIHRAGPLHEAVFASLALPGVFPPVPTPDGRLLVDGGVLDNLPVGTMAADAEGPVIAVDLTRVEAWRPRSLTPPRSWRARARRLISGQDVELPRLAETMFRTLAVGSQDTVAAARRHADIVIRPDVERAGLLDWKALPRMREAGRDAVHRLMEADPDAFRALGRGSASAQ